MNARPILFSGPMIRALLEGRKTQTRRVVKFPKGSVLEEISIPWMRPTIFYRGESILMDCPYGAPGDLLWVREACRAHELSDAEVEKMEPPLGNRDRLYCLDGVIYAADGAFRPIDNSQEAANRWIDLNVYRGKRGAIVPPIHVPRWASRLTLRIADVRVERFQEISEADAVAEGIHAAAPNYPGAEGIYECTLPDGKRHFDDSAARLYFKLWDALNGPGSSAANPYVWALTFEVIKQNVHAVLRVAA